MACKALAAGEGPGIRCGLCGTMYGLEDGKVMEFCPKRNPVEWAQAKINEKNGPVPRKCVGQSESVRSSIHR